MNVLLQTAAKVALILKEVTSVPVPYLDMYLLTMAALVSVRTIKFHKYTQL